MFSKLRFGEILVHTNCFQCYRVTACPLTWTLDNYLAYYLFRSSFLIYKLRVIKLYLPNWHQMGYIQVKYF